MPIALIKKSLKEIIFTLLGLVIAPLWKDSKKDIDKAAIKKILVFEGGGIGDLLRVLPAIKAFHDNFPKAKKSLVAAPHSHEVLKLFPYKSIISEIIDYDPNGMYRSFIKKIFLVKRLREKGFDLIYAPARGQGLRELIIMSFLVGAPYRIGFTEGRIGLLNNMRLDFDGCASILRQNLSLLEMNNIKVRDKNINLKIPDSEKEFINNIFDCNLSKTIIAIHPGVSCYGKYRRWSLSKFIELVKLLLKNYNASVILLGGKEDVFLGNEIIRCIESPAVISLIGKTSISQMAAVIKHSNLFIGNDSGPLHIAIALKTPSVAIFGSTLAEQVLSSMDFCVVVRKELPCSPCYTHMSNFEQNCKDIRCLNEITVSDVMDGVKRMLAVNAKQVEIQKNN